MDTEGLRAHVAAARVCGLPHADRIAGRLVQGAAAVPEAVAKAMADALSDLPRAAYHGEILRPDATAGRRATVRGASNPQVPAQKPCKALAVLQ